MLCDVCLDLGIHLDLLRRVSTILLIEHILHNEDLIVVYFVQGQLLEVLDDDSEVLPSLCESCAEAKSYPLQLKH